jgi:hypothetical protein
MSKKIQTKLSSGKKTLKEGKTVKLGPCIFPFKYKDEIYNECFKGVQGDWCATEVSSKTQKMKKYAFCDYGSDKEKPIEPPDPKETKSGTKKILKFKPKFNPDSLPKELQISEPKRVIPDIYELPNRKTFQNWVFDNYKNYVSKKGSVKFTKGAKFEFFNHQKFVRDYLNLNAPYRGVLLFHGLGVGKTCASIGIAEGFRENRKIVVLLNKSLKKNFIVNLMKCGFEYFRVNQHWVFKDIKSDMQMKLYANFLKIPATVIKKNGGAFFVDFKKTPNYETLSQTKQDMLMLQIEEMIKNKYSFLHLDGLNEARLKKLNEDRYLDDKLLVIDEVHNLSNAMAKVSPGVRGKYLRKLIMDAHNLKCVFLSGTPMINNLYEAGQLFNLLRGYINTFTFTLTPRGNAISIEKLKTILDSHKLVDQIFIDKRDKKIKLTKVPDGFENHSSKNGVIPSEINVGDESFIDIVKKLLTENGYNTNVSLERYTAFPNDEGEFMSLFYDEARNKIKNPKLFQSRILGLVSYYKTQNKELLPTVTKNDVLEIPMSEYQFVKYAHVRKQEIDVDKNKKKKDKPKGAKTQGAKSDGDDAEMFKDKSSYRAYSRMHCSFVFPEDIPRPTPGDEALKQALKGVDKDVKKEYYEKLEKSRSLKSKVEIQLTEAKTKFDLLKKAERSSNSNNNSREELSQKIKELERMQQRILDFEATPDPEYDVEDIEGDVKSDYKNLMKKYEEAKEKTLQKLDTEREKYLLLDDKDKLIKYSPKYNSILKKVNEINGLAFIYTEYRTLEGIATLEIVLRANGYAPFILQRNGDDMVQVFENEDDVDKPKYAMWGGDEEMSDIIRKVYNNDFEEIPKSLKSQLEKSGKNNLRGDILKVLLTTKTGAEGIDLHNVRQVHVVEPFWNPVRVKQVKGRAVRVGSHVQLPPKDRTVEIFTYLAKIDKAQLKSDKQIADDSNGLSSDQVLFDISNRKLEVMEEFLKLIKEVSVDCNLNLEETSDETEKLSCFSFGASPSRDYSYKPNISDEFGDFEQSRRVKVTSWKPIFITIPIQGKKVEFAVKQAPKGEKNLLFNAQSFKLGVMGEPIGHFIETPEGKKKFRFYKKSKKASGVKTKREKSSKNKKKSKKGK